jgi:serralysin
MTTAKSTTASTHTVRTGPGTVQVDLTGQFDDNQSMVIQPDGKILLGGYTDYLAWGYPGAAGEESYGHEQNHSVIRLNADGSLDTSFQEGGVDIVPAAIAPASRYEVTAVQPDGKVLIAIDEPAWNGGVRMERYNSDGTRDLTFGKNGAITVDTGSYFVGLELKVATDGTSLLSVRGFDEAEVIKIANDGTLVESFGDKGVLTLAIPIDDYYYTEEISTAVQADGSVVYGGSYSPLLLQDPFFILKRFNPDGQLDARFGEKGLVFLTPSMGFGDDSVLTVQDDGKIIVMGHGDSDIRATLIRLNTDGSFDKSFGDNGKVSFETDAPMALTVQADGKILATGTSNGDFSIVRFNTDGSLDTGFGSQDGKLHIDGYTGEEILKGTNAAEVIHGLAGDDVLQGNGGRDLLQGGTGADIFRFTELNDSYRTASQNGSDRIQDFDAAQDRIDLTGLGFIGIGDGHNGTLAVQANVDGSRTYLKSYDPDASGHRFELVLDGNLVGQLNSSNLVFTPPTLEGTSGRDTITGSALSEIIYGLGGNDRINGGAGADVIIGGAGADRLDGGDRTDISLWTDNHQNDDIFRYTSTDDSYRTDTQSFVDLIDRLTVDDKIDVAQLGYTGFGDGTGTTLKVAYNSNLDRTYLQDVEADGQGHKFQVAISGDWRESLDDRSVVFAENEQVGLVGVATEVDQGHVMG